MVNKGRIHGELGNFERYLWNSIKSDDELRLEIGQFMILRKTIANPQNKKSSDLDKNSQSNRSLKIGENSYREINLKPKLNWN